MRMIGGPWNLDLWGLFLSFLFCWQSFLFFLYWGFRSFNLLITKFGSLVQHICTFPQLTTRVLLGLNRIVIIKIVIFLSYTAIQRRLWYSVIGYLSVQMLLFINQFWNSRQNRLVMVSIPDLWGSTFATRSRFPRLMHSRCLILARVESLWHLVELLWDSTVFICKLCLGLCGKRKLEPSLICVERALLLVKFWLTLSSFQMLVNCVLNFEWAEKPVTLSAYCFDKLLFC